MITSQSGVKQCNWHNCIIEETNIMSIKNFSAFGISVSVLYFVYDSITNK